MYEDFLKIVLEIINAVIACGLPQNPELVYVMLHRQEVFAPFKSIPRFLELSQNVQVYLGALAEFQFQILGCVSSGVPETQNS